MNRPGPIVRLAGWPPVTLTIFGFSVIAVASWHRGAVPWWFAFLAAGMAFRAAGAFITRRNYNAWAAQWDAMGGEKKTNDSAAAREKKKTSRQVYAITVALALFFVLPSFFPRPEGLGDLARPEVAAWLLCGVYPVLALVLAVIRRVGSKESRRTSDKAAPVSLMLSRTFDSPSREAAVKCLPEYAARILNR